MKSISLLVLACLVSAPVWAQGLPDEINSAPYAATYRSLSAQVDRARSDLNQSQSDLEQAQKFIREMTTHLSELENFISSSESQISSHQRSIPELQGRINGARNEQSSLSSDMRRLQNEESRLHNQHQNEYRNLRPLEDVVTRKQQNIRQLEQEMVLHQRLEREALQRMQSAQQELDSLDRMIQAERDKQRQLSQEQQGVSTRITGLENGIRKLEAELQQIRSQLATDNQKLESLNARVEETRRELETLRSQNAPAEAIKQQEMKLNAVIRTRDKLAQELRSVPGQINERERQIAQNRQSIEQVRRDQANIPARIAESEARERSLVSSRQGKIQNVERFRQEHANAVRNIQVREQALSSARIDIRQDENNLNRQRESVDRLALQLDELRRSISSLQNRHRSLEGEITQLSNRIRDLEAEIPQLRQEIAKAKEDITQGRKDIIQAQKDVTSLTESISIQEKKLAQLTSSRDQAEDQMNQRANLYARYLVEAQSLGSSQSDSAIGLGQAEGAQLAQSTGKLNGSSIGQELGGAEAKHWGYVRGETQGYEKGYLEGQASIEDTERGSREGSILGKKDAQSVAQTQYRPIYFEELLLEEFKRPLAPSSAPFKGSDFKSKLRMSRMENVLVIDTHQTIDPLSRAEIEASQALATPLDEMIVSFAKEVKSIEAKAKRLADAEVAYTTPSKIPFGQANCAQVYKGLGIFKSACDAEYKSSFQEKFLTSTKSSFRNSYFGIYEISLNESQLTKREASFPKEYADASKISSGLGLKIGKEENYKKNFSLAYRSTYDQELPVAKEKARGDALLELNQFMQTRPLMTLASGELSATNFRGGEEITVLNRVKNISRVPFKGASAIRILEASHAEVIVGEAVLGEAQAQGISPMPELKVRVLSTAKAGDVVKVKGEAYLPGDLYHSQRVESFEYSQVLAANPAHQTGLNYDSTPSIKGIFRRNIHFLTVTLTPEIEDLPEGYQLTLSKKADNSPHVNLNETSLVSGALKRGQGKEVRFSYVFNDSAKNKTVVLELSISYAGKVLKTQSIELKPH